MSTIWRNRTLALGGLLQAIHSVQEIARHGNAPTEAIATSLASIFKTDPKGVEDIYGSVEGVSLGLQTLTQQLDRKRHRPNPDLLRYLINIMYLEQRLKSRPQILTQIGEQIREIAHQQENFSPTHPQVISRLADVYLNTISTLTPRIQIRGEETHLRQPENIERIRALLLAAIRSAVLWRQVGGNRFHLLFRSRQLLQEARTLLQEPPKAGAA
jgi:high frequency lysogenization protein